MKSILLAVFMLAGTHAFAQQAFFDAVKGKAITGRSVEGINTRFEFSQDGKTVLLKKNTGYRHTFVKMVQDIAIYQGKRGGKTHYDGFQVQGSIVFVATSDQIGGIQLRNNTPEGLATMFEANRLMFEMQ